MSPHRSSLFTFLQAHSLRNDPTRAEKKLWSKLRGHRLAGAGFRRQHAIGPYIVDFCCPGWKVIVEVDGSQHAEHQEHDTLRTKYLEDRGYRVLRFWNNEVFENIEAVLDRIMDCMEEVPGIEKPPKIID